jgi:hypothetical protein
MKLDILPLAFTMLAGPQIMTAIIFVTAPKALELSAHFLAGVVIAVTVGVTVTHTLATLFGNSISLGDSSDSGSLGHIIQYLLVGLLVHEFTPRHTPCLRERSSRASRTGRTRGYASALPCSDGRR